MTQKNTHYMFAYGMNTNVDSMSYRCPLARLVGTGTLDNFVLDFRYHADVSYKHGQKTVGVVWEMSDSDMEAMDKFEGRPYYYGRIKAPVIVGTELYNSWVYVMKDKSYVERPSNEYFISVLEGYKENDVPISQLFSAVERIGMFKNES